MIYFIWLGLLQAATCHQDYLNDNELKLAMDLVQELEIRQLTIAIPDDSLIHLRHFKKISYEFKSATFILPKEFGKYFLARKLYSLLVDEAYMTGKTMIVAKMKHSAGVFSRQLPSITSMINSESYIADKFVWLVLIGDSYIDDTVKVPYSCQFITARVNPDASYNLSEIYFVKSQRITADYGTWDPILGLNVIKKSAYYRRLDMNYSTFTALDWFENCNMTALRHMEKRLFCYYYGIVIDIAKHLNFRYEEKTKSEVLEYDTVDRTSFDVVLLLTDLSLFRFNYEEDSFIKVLPTLKMYMYIKYPKDELTPDYYIRPFHYSVWITILFLIIFGGIIFVTIQYVDTHILKNGNNFQFQDFIFLAHESFCNQCSEERTNNSFRIACAMFRFLALFIVPALSADLTSYLAIRTLQIPFLTLGDFVQNGKYKMLQQHDENGDGYYYNYFESDDPIQHKIYANYSEFYKYPEENPFTKLCSATNLAFTFPPFEEIEKIPCQLLKIPRTVDNINLVIKLGFGYSHYEKIFNYFFLKVIEAGIFKEIQETREEEIAPPSVTENDLEPINITQTSHIFSMIPVGICLAWTVLIRELIIKIVIQRKRRSFKIETVCARSTHHRSVKSFSAPASNDQLLALPHCE